MVEQFTVKNLTSNDYYLGYLELMYEFSNHRKNITYEEFEEYIEKPDIRTVVIHNNDNKIIGAGTIFKLNKLHNNPIGQIEDVIITEKYRKKHLGKMIIENLTNIGINEFKCYKVVLNCLDKNITFYEKCEFFISGVQMRRL